MTKIYHRADKIEGDKIQWNPASILEHTRGEYPSISLADDGHILEVRINMVGHYSPHKE